ncbi:prepilin peptidase [Algiphilus sp.]|uniref:prepilin peptidase n=1 Tax=Algiphilus sp. TaxID=1872431 RepID=UPI003B522A4D
MTVEYALACLLVAVTAIAALRDWQQRRIPNLLPLLLIAGGSVALLLRSGGSDSLLSSTLQSVAGLGIAAAATLPGYWSGAMGAGDVKLLASIGWALAWPGAFALVLLWAIAFAIWCGVAWCVRRRTRQPVAPSILVGHAAVVAMAVP